MEDSSTNPYIPQQSAEIQNKVYRRQSPLGRIVKIALIVSGVLTALLALALVFIVPRTSADDSEARMALANTVQPPSQLTKHVPVTSGLGFSLKYENQLFTSYAEVQPPEPTDDDKERANIEYYENNDLRLKRDYDYVRVRPIESAEASRGLVVLPPEVTVSATITPIMLDDNAGKPEYKGLSKLSLFMKLNSEKRLAERVSADGTTVVIEESQPSARTINDVQFQKVRYTTTNDNYRIATTKYDDCYYTIQNDMPYAACVENIRPNNVDATALVEQVIATIEFQKPTNEKAAMPASSATGAADEPKDDKSAQVSIRLAQASSDTERESDESSDKLDDVAESTQEEAELVAITPEYEENPLSLKAITKTQPSVVRIGALYCADLALKFENGQTATTLTDACIGSVSSGVFVSEQGHVATTGHAIRFSPKSAISGYINFAESRAEAFDRLDRVLQYMLDARFLYESDVRYLTNGATTGDQEALAKIENLASYIPDNYVTPVKEAYSYSVQPSDRPIVVNRNDARKPTFAYSDSVKEAVYVGSNYDIAKAAQSTFGAAMPDVDTGILKVEGSYQNVGVPGSKTLSAGERLTILGLPAYVDSGLFLDKVRNAPLVTAPKIQQVFENQKLVQIDEPTLPGNDGAPAFDQTGDLIGFATYGLSYCPDQQCFSSGTVRSVSELNALVAKQNIALGGASGATVLWSRAVDEYFKANYAKAEQLFAEAGGAYQFNKLAEPLQKLSAEFKGSEHDTSLFNQLQGAFIIVIIITALATLGLTAAFIVDRRRLDAMQVGHYGVQAPVYGPAPAAAVPVQQPYPQPQQGWTPQMQSQSPPAASSQGWSQPQPQQQSAQNAWQQPGSTQPQQQPVPGYAQPSQYPQQPPMPPVQPSAPTDESQPPQNSFYQ